MPSRQTFLLFFVLMASALTFVGCTQPAVDPASADFVMDDPEAQFLPTGKAPPAVIGTWSFIGTGTTSEGHPFTLTLGGKSATRLSAGKINLNSNQEGTYVVEEDGGEEVYAHSKGGGGIHLNEGALSFKIKFTDPEGVPGILKFKGQVSVGIEDGLAVGTFEVREIEAVYIEGKTRDPLRYENAQITLDAKARVGTFTFEAVGTAEHDGQTVDVSIRLTGVAKGFSDVPVIKWNAREGHWTHGDEVYLLVNGPGAIKVETGQIRYNGNFVEQGSDEPGIGKFRGIVSGITLNHGKVQGTFPVTIAKAIYIENDGTEVPATIASASITFEIK